MKKNTEKNNYNPFLLTQIQPQGGIKVLDDYIRKGDGYEQVINVYEYPSNVADFWLERLLSIGDCITTVDIGTLDKRSSLKKIDKSMVEQSNRYHEDTSPSEQIKAQDTYNSLKILAHDINTSGEVIKLVHIRYYVSAKTKSELESKTRDIIEELETIGYRSAVCLNEQEYEWKSLFNGYLEQEKFLNKRKGKAIPSVSLGGGYPFHFTYLDDPTGTFYGTTFTGGSVIFDLFTSDDIRRFYNAVVVGSMGSGKSTFLKKLVLDNAIKGETIRILDIVGEFKTLVESLGGKKISLDGEDGIINPLQVLATIVDEDTFEVNNHLSFMTHMSKVSMMYKFLAPECSNEEQREFEKILSKFYVSFNIDVEKSTEYKSTEYPIMSDLLEFTKRELYSDVEQEIIFENISSSKRERLDSIILNLESIVRDYGKIFNGHSTIEDINNTQIISFELRNLTQLDKRIFNAQIFNILTLLWNNALVQGRREKTLFENKKKSKEDSMKYLLVIDEAHRIINSNNIMAVDYLSSFSREARKYFAGLIFATQNISDVVPDGSDREALNKIKILFELTQYKFIMKQDNNLLSTLNKIFEGQLSQNELHKIPRFKQGNCILSISGLENITFNIEASREELDLFKGGA